MTTENADSQRVNALANNGIDVIAAGENSVCGRQLVNQLMLRGLGIIYSAAGPRLLHVLVKANVLDRLYMTVATRLIGGDPYDLLLPNHNWYKNILSGFDILIPGQNHKQVQFL